LRLQDGFLERAKLRDQSKTKAQLIEELQELRQHVAELQVSEAEHHRLQHALWESEEHYRQLAELSSDAILVHREGQIVFVNTAAAKMLGAAEPAGLVGRPISDFVHSGDRSVVEGRLWRVLQAGRPIGFVQQKITGLDGKIIDAEVASTPLVYDARPAVQMVARHITSRGRIEHALRESEERLSQIIQQMPYPVQICDLDGTATMVNQAYLDTFRVPSADLIVGKYNILNDPLLIKHRRLKQAIRSAYRGEVVFVPEMVLPLGQLNQDYSAVGEETGTMVHEITMFPVFLQSGEIWRVVTIWHDITERKEASETLRRRNLELELFNRASETFISTLDLDQVLYSILDEVRRLLGVVACSIWLVDPETGELVCHHATGPKRELVKGWRLPPGQGVAGWVAGSGESLIISDVLSDERHFEGVDQRTGLDIRSMLTVPLQIKSRVFGVIQVLDKEVGRFTASDLRLMEPLAVSAATAVENARLYLEADKLRAFNENIVQSMEEGILIQDEEGRITFANRSAAELLGYLPVDLTGHTWKDLVVPGQMARRGDCITQRQAGANQYETVLLTKGGQQVPVIISDSPLFENDRFTGVLSVFTDITERVQAEDALYRRNRELSMLNQIMAASASGLKPEAILETACRELALTFDVPRAFVALLNDGKSQATIVAEYRAEGRKSALKFKIPVHKEESFRYLLSNKAPLLVVEAQEDLRLMPLHSLLDEQATDSVLWLPLTIEAEVVGGLAMDLVEPGKFSAEDISLAWSVAGQLGAVLGQARFNEQRQQLEEQYHQAQKMEAVGRLTAGIAHDFNNLLTAINGFTQLMRLDLPSDDPRQEMLNKIWDSGRRAADLIRQLLVFSRKQVIELQVVDLNEIVSEMDKMLRRIIGEDIELRVALTPGLWSIKMDPAQIEQVIVNLAVNARDAMPGGGLLTIETANVILDKEFTAGHLGAQPGEHVMLTVSDTGAGMSEEVKERIFEPFFTTKEPGKGTGLGLATAFSIVKQGGGTIWVYSEQGAGSTFKIYLPRALEDAEFLIPQRPTTDMPPGDETILLVEDDEGVRDLAQRVLEGQGYIVLDAQNGQEALLVSTHHPGSIQLLLTDVVMPGISGKALADQLARSRPDLKVLFMSGYSDEAIVHHGVLDAGVAFLQKPFSPQALTQKVRQVLDAPPHSAE
jgi:PAS domain S-box-containing protein